MLKFNNLDSNDSLDEMLDKFTMVSNFLTEESIQGQCQRYEVRRIHSGLGYEEVYRELAPDSVRNSSTYPYVYTLGDSQGFYRRVYKLDDIVKLKDAISLLVTEIKFIVKSSGKEDSHQHEIEAKRILDVLYKAMLSPSPLNISTLDRIQIEVNGHGNVWAKVGIVLATITALPFAIIGSLVGLIDIPKAWNDASQKGLSLSTKKFSDVLLASTGAKDLKTDPSYKFFDSKPDIFVQEKNKTAEAYAL